MFPPSPPKLPLIGNLHQLGSCMYLSLHALSQKHGPIILLHLGSVPTLIASSSEVAREILNTHDLSFSSRPKLPIAEIVAYGGRDIAFSPYGDFTKQLKKIAVVHLLSAKRVMSFQKVREKQIGLMFNKLEESCGSFVDMGAMLISLSNNYICMATIGRTYDGLKLIGLLRNFFDLLNVVTVGACIPWLAWVDRLTGLVGRAEKCAKEFDEYLEDIIEEHKNKKTANKGEDETFIDILLDVQNDTTTGFTFYRDTIKAVILDAFAGGTETSALSVEMALCELIRHPQILKKLQEEITEVAQGRCMINEEDLEKMQYLKAVIKETLRMHPLSPLLGPHASTQDVKLMGYDIPAGTQVLINAWTIGRDPTLWEEPTEFKPERFLPNSMNYSGNHNFEWLPFSAGRRQCPGIQFAMAFVELVLANIVYKFDLELPKGMKALDLDMTMIYAGMVIRRKSPLMVIPKPRF